MKDKIIALLGQGHPAAIVAQSLGVSESRISQIASEPEVSAQISALRFESLQKFSDLDTKYLSVEEKLLDKLENSLIFLQRPMEIARALQIVNKTKRRGAESPMATTVQQNIVNISMPTQVLQKFTVNGQNQVVQVGSQTLLTLPSQKVSSLMKEKINDSTTEKRLSASAILAGKLTAADI